MSVCEHEEVGTPADKQQSLILSMMAWGEHSLCKLPEYRDLEGWTSDPLRSRRENRMRELACGQVCAVCPVRVNCLHHALHYPEIAGFWAGLNSDELHDERRRQRIL